MTKKAIQLARRSALSLKATQEGVMVVENFDFETPRTKDMAIALTNLGLEGKKILVLTPGKVESIYKSGRNLPGVRVLESNKPTTYDIMHAEVLVFLEGGLEELQSQLAVDPAVQKARETRVSEAQAKIEAAAKAKFEKKLAGSKKTAASKSTATKSASKSTTKATETAKVTVETPADVEEKPKAAAKTTAKKTTAAKTTAAKATATKKAAAPKKAAAKSTATKSTATKPTAAKKSAAKPAAKKTTKTTKKDSGEDKS